MNLSPGHKRRGSFFWENWLKSFGRNDFHATFALPKSSLQSACAMPGQTELIDWEFRLLPGRYHQKTLYNG